MHEMNTTIAYFLLHHSQLLGVFPSLLEYCFDMTHDMRGILHLKIILCASITETVSFEVK